MIHAFHIVTIIDLIIAKAEFVASLVAATAEFAEIVVKPRSSLRYKPK